MASVLAMVAAVTPSATYAAVCTTAAAAAAAVAGCNGFRQTDLQTH